MKATPSDSGDPTATNGSDETVKRHLRIALEQAESDTTKFHLRQALQLVELR